jgi:hypothetical protein
MRPEWTAAAGTPAPSGFTFLGFPASKTVKLFDAPGGAEAGTLDRAVGVGRNEESGEWVQVAGNPKGAVRRSEVVLEPPEGWQGLFESYKAARKKNEGVEFVGALLKTERLPDGRLRVEFWDSQDDWQQVSTYVVQDGRGHAEAFATQGKEAGFEWGFAFIMRVAWVMPVTLVVGVIGTWLLRRAVIKKARTKGLAVPVTEPA